MATSRSTLMRELANDLFREGYLEFTALSNGDSTTTVVPATELRDTDASSNKYDGGYLYVYGGTAAGDARRLSGYTPTANATYGTVTTGRPLSTTLDTTSTCFLYTGPLSPTDLQRCLNKALRRLRRNRLLAITHVSDGLMEDSGTSSWTGSNATLAKGTGSGNVLEGTQCLTVTNTAANGQAQSTSVNCIPGDQYIVEAVVRGGNTSGTHTATLIAYDVTNSATIQSATTANRERTRIRFQFAVPSGCVQLQMRLQGSASTSVMYWDEVILWPTNNRQFVLPADITRFDQIIAVKTRWDTYSSPSGEANTERPYSAAYNHVNGWNLISDENGVAEFILDTAGSDWSSVYPLYVECLLPWPELSTDAATTNAPIDDVVLRARGIAYAELAEGGPHEDRSWYEQQAKKYGVLKATEAAFQPRPARQLKTPGRQARKVGVFRGVF